MKNTTKRQADTTNLTSREKDIIMLGIQFLKDTPHNTNLKESMKEQFLNIADNLLNKLKNDTTSNTNITNDRYTQRRENMLVYYVLNNIFDMSDIEYYDEEYARYFDALYEYEIEELEQLKDKYHVRHIELNMIYKEIEDITEYDFGDFGIMTNL